MTEQNRRRRRRHSSSPTVSSRRLLVAGSAGLFLIASAYQFAFAGATLTERPQVGLTAGYGFSPNTVSGSDSSGGGHQAGFLPYSPGNGAAGAPGAEAAIQTAGNIGALAIGAAEAFPEEFPALSSEAGTLAEARLVPERDELRPGMACRFHFEVKSADTGKWYSVTDLPGARIEIDDPAALMVRQDGSSHTFCVPITASRADGERKVSFTGTYTPEGGEPVSAQATVVVRAVD